MLISLQNSGENYRIDTAQPLDIAIPLNFNGAQPNAYGVQTAASKSCEAGELVGDTRRGGSCNFEQYTFIPHCNGTHTECVGHITNERIFVRDCLQDAFVTAILISVKPEKFSETKDTYPFDLSDDDLLITRNLLEEKLIAEAENRKPKAVVIRTLPNDDGKLTKTYLEEIPPFFSNEAMQFLTERGVKHLLVDLPSIDRIFDGGKLSNHRIFWNVETESFETNDKTRIENTITELIYVSNKIADGQYILNLQIPSFATDAAPSRPLLFQKIKKSV